MMEKFSINDFLRSLVLPHPARDWAVAVVLLLALFVGLAGYAGYMFWGVYSGTIVAETGARTLEPKVTRAGLADVLEAYRARKANFEARNFQLSGFSDPGR